MQAHLDEVERYAQAEEQESKAAQSIDTFLIRQAQRLSNIGIDPNDQEVLGKINPLIKEGKYRDIPAAIDALIDKKAEDKEAEWEARLAEERKKWEMERLEDSGALLNDTGGPRSAGTVKLADMSPRERAAEADRQLRAGK